MRAGHAQTFANSLADAIPRRQPTFALLPAALALDPVEAFGQAVAVHHQIVVGERRRGRHQVDAANGKWIETKRVRHVIQQAFEGEANINSAVAAKGAAWRRVGQHALPDIFDIVQIIDRIQHRAGIKDSDDAVARMRTTTLDAFALDSGDAPVLAHPELEPDIGLRPAAMGDERLLAVDHRAHATARLARKQRRDQLDIERLGTAAEAAADIRLDHADPRHVHAENLRQHEVHVIGHLR
jgi:hypothetical protein